jgi:hypothetical protein
VRTIYTSTGIASLAVDSAGQIYALTQDGIEVFAANASGNATPTRQLPALTTTTTLNYPLAIAVDSAQNIYVANAINILVFSSTANGNVAPARTITWSTALGAGADGIAVDANGDIFVTTYFCMKGATSCTSTSQILEFAAGANGLVTPANALTILPNSSFPYANNGAVGVAVDGAGNLYAQVLTITENGLGVPSFLDAVSVEVFTPGQTGSSAPAQTITPAAWTDSASSGLAIH